MSQIGSSELGELLRRSLGVKGPVQLDLIDQVQPVVLIADLTDERAQAQSIERSWGLRFNSAAVAAQSSKFAIGNVGSVRPTSDLLIDELIVQPANVMGYSFGFMPVGSLAVGTIVPAHYFDGEFGMAGAGIGVSQGYDLFTQSNAATIVTAPVGGGVGWTTYGPVYHRFDYPLVIPPGTMFIVEGATFNVELRGTLRCRERARVL